MEAVQREQTKVMDSRDLRESPKGQKVKSMKKDKCWFGLSNNQPDRV